MNRKRKDPTSPHNKAVPDAKRAATGSQPSVAGKAAPKKAAEAASVQVLS